VAPLRQAPAGAGLSEPDDDIVRHLF
jgi:hypothetical protein